MNLVQINERLKDLPMQVIQQYANGMNPEVPPYLALGELQRRELSQKQMATAQGAMQGPQPSVKEQVEQKAGLMQLQQMQQQQMVQQQAQPRGPMPAPAGISQPEDQPEVAMASGGLASVPMSPEMFEYANGGIVAFAYGGDTMGTPTLRDQDLASQAAELAAEERKKVTAAAKIAELEKKANELDYVAPEMAEKVRMQIAALTAAPKPAKTEQAQPIYRPEDATRRVNYEKINRAEKAPPAPSPVRTAAPAAAPTAIPATPVEPQAGLPAAAQSANQYESRLNELALKTPTAPTTQEAISRVSELSPAAMQEAALQKRNEEMRQRATSYKEQFEKSRPSGLDDLIRVFGQAGQYKGLSGLAPAYTANQQQQRADELAMTKQYNELMNLADTKELEGNKELFGARTKAFDTAQQLFGKEKEGVIKSTASLYETTQSRINNELKMLTDKEIQNLRMIQETKIKGMEIGQRERERTSLNARDPNALIAQYVGLKAKARELREDGKIPEADRLEAQAADMMTFKGGSGTAGVGMARNAIMERRQEMKDLDTVVKNESGQFSEEEVKFAARRIAELVRANAKDSGNVSSGPVDTENPLLKK